MKHARNRKKALVAASIAGLMAVAGSSVLLSGTASAEDVACYGVNKCKGTGDCGGKGSSCAGKNACMGQGFIKISKDNCLRIKDGRLTPEPEAAQQ